MTEALQVEATGETVGEAKWTALRELEKLQPGIDKAAVQFQVLGLERYSELFVRSFVNTKLHFTVPLEAHAFSLESKFFQPAAERFSVEQQVRLWAEQGRYAATSLAAHR